MIIAPAALTAVAVACTQAEILVGSLVAGRFNGAIVTRLTRPVKAAAQRRPRRPELGLTSRRAKAVNVVKLDRYQEAGRAPALKIINQRTVNSIRTADKAAPGNTHTHRIAVPTLLTHFSPSGRLMVTEYRKS